MLKVENLKTYLYTQQGIIKAVDDISFSISKGEKLGLVGESGSGKTMTALSIMRLVPSPPGKIINGNIIFENKNLCTISENEMQKIRGKDIAMIFQEPVSSLNPIFTIGDQIAEVLRFHTNISKEKVQDKVLELLAIVGISSPRQRIQDYPHNLSGGMCQRVMIAMALAGNPKLLIADEPTTALDVTIQAQILNLLLELNKTMLLSILLITHDLGIVAEICDTVAIMNAGKIVEQASVQEIFNNPKHPYTIKLLEAMPRLGKKKGESSLKHVSFPNVVIGNPESF
ncbi:MAG: ABC transporter ATP-binding protein [Candidatus Firestonebacteria bacterium]